MTFTLLPAVDVADGKAVRLVQGEAGTEKTYGVPRDAALLVDRWGVAVRVTPVGASGSQIADRADLHERPTQGRRQGPQITRITRQDHFTAFSGNDHCARIDDVR